MIKALSSLRGEYKVYSILKKYILQVYFSLGACKPLPEI